MRGVVAAVAAVGFVGFVVAWAAGRRCLVGRRRKSLGGRRRRLTC